MSSHGEHTPHTAHHGEAHHGEDHHDGKVDTVKDVTVHKARLSLGNVGSNELTLFQASSGVTESVGNAVKAILNLGKNTVSSIGGTLNDIKSTPGIAGKTAFTIASPLKVALDIGVGVMDMLVKQGENIGNIVANLTAWKRIPTPVANAIRTPFALVGWLMKPFNVGSSHKEVVAAGNHH